MPKTQAVNPQSFTSLGEMLHFLRERAHLSQRELAALVGYHHSYVSYIEKNMRIPDEASLLGRFIPALGLEDHPEWSKRMLKLVRNKPSIPVFYEEELPRSEENVYQLLPSLTSMLGREHEVTALNEILQRTDVRLVTIVGPPGVGKTRLALHIAEQESDAFTDGVLFVNLMPITQVELLIPAIANALGVHEIANVSVTEKVKAALRKKNMLIVMDNFEQLVDAAPQLIPLLGDAPNIKILATSREALRVRGEQEFPLAPLTILDDLFLDSPAVQLFIERARAIKPDFEIRDQTASHVAEICRRLDGLPLAIELAAARIQTLSLPAMLEQFDRRFEWLTRGARDQPAWRQTLWGVVEWSYNLLSGQERALLNRLSTFVGGWTIEAAESICSDETLCAPSDIFNLLMQLSDKSLVMTDGMRYHLLETLREFSQEKLKESGELEFLKQRHCDHFLKFAQTAHPHLVQGGNQAHWLNQMELEHNNLHAALTWAVASPAHATTAMEFGCAVHPFWSARSYITEARHWLGQILALDHAPNLMRVDLLGYAGEYASTQGDYATALLFNEEGLVISKTLGNEAGVCYSLGGMAKLAGMQGDYARAAELLEQVLPYWRKNNDALRLTVTLNNLALATRRLGYLKPAQKLYRESISISKTIGNLKSLAVALNGLAEVHVELQEYNNAVLLQRESISIRHKLGDLKGLAFSFESLATSLDHLGNSLLAAELESACNRIFRDLGIVNPLATRAESEKFVAQLRVKLSDSVFDSAWQNGQTISAEQAVTLAMKNVRE